MNNNKVAFITGAAKRIGKSIAVYLGKNRWNLVVQYNKSRNEIIKLEEELKDFKIDFYKFKYNFEKDFNYGDFYKKILSKSGKIDLLINNASAFDFDTIKDSSNSIFDKHVNVNLKAPFFLSSYFAQNIGRRKGIIINILDQRVKNITPYFASYTVSKVGLYALTRSMALNLAPRIRVNGISPGPTLKSKNQTTEQFKKQCLKTPLSRQVKLDEINSAIEYIIKNESVTGQVLTLDSGQSLGWANSKSKIFATD